MDEGSFRTKAAVKDEGSFRTKAAVKDEGSFRTKAAVKDEGSFRTKSAAKVEGLKIMRTKVAGNGEVISKPTKTALNGEGHIKAHENCSKRRSYQSPRKLQ